MSAEPPEGFVPHARKSPVTDAWEPLFSRAFENAVQIGVVVRPQHCVRGQPSRSFIATLADNAMQLTCRTALPAAADVLTAHLTIDYLGEARLGQWLQVEPRILRVGGGIAFADALVTADGAIVARAGGSFRALG